MPPNNESFQEAHPQFVVPWRSYEDSGFDSKNADAGGGPRINGPGTIIYRQGHAVKSYEPLKINICRFTLSPRDFSLINIKFWGGEVLGADIDGDCGGGETTGWYSAWWPDQFPPRFPTRRSDCLLRVNLGLGVVKGEYAEDVFIDYLPKNGVEPIINRGVGGYNGGMYVGDTETELYFEVSPQMEVIRAVDMMQFQRSNSIGGDQDTVWDRSWGEPDTIYERSPFDFSIIKAQNYHPSASIGGGFTVLWSDGPIERKQYQYDVNDFSLLRFGNVIGIDVRPDYRGGCGGK